MIARFAASVFVFTIAAPCLSPMAWAVEPAPAGAPLDWNALESGTLQRQTQLTFPGQFEKAGEAYFSPDGGWIVFQAVATPAAGEAPSPHYAMYVAKLRRSPEGHVDGIEAPILISPPGAANTCGFFHPLYPWRLIFGSTLTPPSQEAHAGYQRGQNRYIWQFPSEMEVCARSVVQIFYDLHPQDPNGPMIAWGEEAREAIPIWTRPGYDAECSFSPDGRFIVYTAVDEKTSDADIHIYDTTTHLSRPIIVAKGYDGGPFFSPDGKRLCYRSDRAGDDLLQVFVADLKFDESGVPIGVANERQVTKDQNVNWAPYWHPSGAFLVFTSSRIGHDNYEIFAVKAPAPGAPSDAPLAAPVRVTSASGFDGMPVFNARGDLLMWTSQRGPKLESEAKPSSQIWIAEVAAMSP